MANYISKVHALANSILKRLRLHIKKKIAKLPGAFASRHHHFAKIINRVLKADGCVQRLEKASPRNPKKLLSFQGRHFARILLDY